MIGGAEEEKDEEDLPEGRLLLYGAVISNANNQLTKNSPQQTSEDK